jgi:succinate dehydrogenase flavin-adding protein (antitoxin of CptAB toxin-antitoxin module)
MALPTKFTALENFQLAFDRLIRGQNRDYKSFFRHLHSSYQLALTENLHEIVTELKRGTYEPQSAICIYQPKKSGVLRPLRLLTLKDQIVYQAIINVIAESFRADQRKYAFQQSFGAILAAKSSSFFYRSWKRCYRELDSVITKAFNRGYDYVADFDLVSFYELIDHRLLRTVLERRVKSPQLLDLLFGCLEKWTEHAHGALHHGIPQGPEASAFLAECFLFVFDRIKFKNVVYARYIDDIKLMAKGETPVRRALLQLDIKSKHVGLVPQAQKIECRRIANLNELRKNVPSNVASITVSDRVTPSSHRRLEKIFRASIRKERGLWIVYDTTRFKFALLRLNATRPILRRVAQILPHRPDLSWVFSSYLKKFQNDKEAANILLGALRRDPAYDLSAAHYIGAMDVCEPTSKFMAYRRVIQTAERRSLEKSLVLSVAAATFRGRRSGPKDALILISKQKHPLGRSILLHRLFGDDSRAPFKRKDAQNMIENETKSDDADLARYCAARLIDLWPWSKQSWKPNTNVNASVKILLKSVGLRQRGPKKIGILDRFFHEQQRIAIPIVWRSALGNDWRDAERRCLRLQELQVGDPASSILMLDTFNEVLIENFSRRHPKLRKPFQKATPAGRAQPDFGNWIDHPTLLSVLPKAVLWLKEVHAQRVQADLAHAKSRKGKRTRPVSYGRRTKLQKAAQSAWAELLREWHKIL